MKKFITMIIAAASMMTAVSCNRAFDEKEVPSDGTIYVTRTYEAGLNEVTKTTIDATGKVTWEQGDLIRYYSQKNGEVKTYTIDAPSAKAELALDVASTANFLIGVYGGTALTDNLGSSVNIQGAIPTEQTGVFGDHHVAITKTYDVTQQSLTFHNIVSYLKFTLTRSDVAKVVFKANDATQLHGNGSVTVSLPDETPSAAFGSEGGSSITVLNGGAGTFYIATLPCTLAEGFQADCYDAAGTYLGSASTSKSVEVRANKVLNLGIIDTRIEKMYTDLSAEGTANCYIISEPGNYKIKANVKGNSTEPLDGTPAIAEVLWESFGTDVAPTVGDLISGVSFKDGYIHFTASALKGNAVIAVEDRNEDILWSWHIWLTDKPSDQVYNNGAGTMMDRNLGATSATPGDVHALGLLYQWGRKDPFLGGESISSSVQAKSTASWPAPIEKDASCGTIEYATSYPTTFIKSSYDWYYTSSLSIYEDTRWQDTKTVYDPCPPGYKVPSGSFDGFWFKALNVSANWTTPSNVDATNKGMNFSITDHKLGMAPVIWYPFAGDIDGYFGGISNVGRRGGVWTYATWTYDGCYFGYWDDGSVFPTQSQGRATGRSVRCVKESTTEPEPDAMDLSADGTANSYIVSAAGDYKIKAVRGNSSESVGSVASAEVLWESFGTNVAPSVGDLVSNVSVDGEYIKFKASALKGNASIAAKDASGTILWSWHIWMTDQPEDQTYYGNTGVMLDRNLGATSAKRGDGKALGLFYQYGRKDPFLGAKSVSSKDQAASTATWPASVNYTTTRGSLEYTKSHPMTFVIAAEGLNSDSHSWESSKSINDPCPVGYRIPDGGDDGIWKKTVGGDTFRIIKAWSSTYHGLDLGGTNRVFGDAASIWYPGAGKFDGQTIVNVATHAYYGTCLGAISVNSTAYVNAPKPPYGFSVRCQKIL
ncbi:MAG: hypothetical protein MJZ09_05775 [Bacteroidales bacterium]|nr:hypothetical protein [Bacteroidales bacterium]